MEITARAGIASASLALLLAWPSPSPGFHSGGVGDCDGCHTMHNSLAGEPMNPALPRYASGPYLLRGSDASSTCLHCHQQAGDTGPNGNHVSTADADMPEGFPPLQLTPGGDFGWLKKTYRWPGPSGTTLENPGERHGHNIVAQDYGYVQDAAHPTAPGGSYPAERLACNGCHDPHGKYRRLADGSIATTGLPIVGSGSYADSPDPTSWGAVGVYRHLGGVGYQPASLGGGHAFAHGPPAAVAPRDYNRSEAVTQTRVAYGQGISEWCANCHVEMLEIGYESGAAGHIHPAGDGAHLTADVVANYSAYVKTGDLSGMHEQSYLSLVPFEEGTDDYAQLGSHARTDDGALEGPGTTSNVACVSCHRSHASAFDSKTRWGHGSEFLTVADEAGNATWPDPAIDPTIAQGRTPAETQQAYYGRPAARFAPMQRDLCNKCHAKD